MVKFIQRTFLVVIVANLFFSCRGIDLPSKDISKREIDFFVQKIDSLKRKIKELGTIPTISANDFVVDFNLEVFNKILRKFTLSKEDDVVLHFLPTKPLFSEEKNLFGIKYTNYINIDTGDFTLNLKSLKLGNGSNNIINAILELEGWGIINVTGKYAGISATAKPEVEVYFFEPVKFGLSSVNGIFRLTPLPKVGKLKTRIKIKLLNWDLPYYQEIPLEITKLINTLEFPIGFAGELSLPKPPAKVPNQLDEVIYSVILKSPKVKIENGHLLLETNISLNPKN